MNDLSIHNGCPSFVHLCAVNASNIHPLGLSWMFVQMKVTPFSKGIRIRLRIYFFFPLENWDVTIAGVGLKKFDLCSALMAIEQWGFFSMSLRNMPHLLWHGISVYNGHLSGPVTLTPITERLVVELSPPVFTTLVYRVWYSNTQPSACEANALTKCAPPRC